jgi:transposase
MFSGKRVKRGLYRASNDVLVNADINAALNIMRKSNAVDIKILCARGEVDTPVRIRVA